MIDLEIRCDVCARVPAVFRLNNATVCATCARQAIDRACVPQRPAPVVTDPRTPDEIAEQLLTLVRASGRPLATERLRNALRVGSTKLTSALDRLVSSGALVRTQRGYHAAESAAA